MHGPRLSGSGRRERRKTVTFDERCDVVEFDRDEETDEDVFDSTSEDEEGSDGSMQEERQIHIPDLPTEDTEANAVDQDDDSYDSVPLDQDDKKDDALMDLDHDTSITGIVENMFFGVNARPLADGSFASVASTPPRQGSLPPDLETEDGIPLGRSHHVERFLQHQQHHSPAQAAPHFSPRNSPRQGSPQIHSPGRYPFNLNLPTHASPHGPPATPPRRSPGMTHATPPLGRSTHAERVGEAREQERDETSRGVERLPSSPSPVKPLSAHEHKGDGLIPRFSLPNGSTASLVEEAVEAKVAGDVFAQSRLLDESISADLEAHDSVQEDLSSNTSISSSAANVSSLCAIDNSQIDDSAYLDADTGDSDETEESDASTEKEVVAAPSTPSRQVVSGSPVTRSGSHLVRGGSPLTRLSSPLSSTTGLQVNRPRISKDDVKRRLLGRRSLCSPSPEPRSPEHSVEHKASPIQPLEVNMNLAPLEQDRDRMSIMTGMTDMSTDTAVVAHAERVTMAVGSLVSPREDEEDQEFGLLKAEDRFKFDFGSKFSLGHLGMNRRNDDDDDAMDEDEDNATTRTVGMRMGDHDVDMEMKSALDRLMEDVAGGPVDDSLMTDDSFISQDSQLTEVSLPERITSRPMVLERAATDTALLHSVPHISSRTVSGSSTLSGSSVAPPPVPPKDNIKAREQLIIQKRREARGIIDDDTEDENEEGERASRPSKRNQKHLSVGRPSHRRSLSTGDVEDPTGRGRSLLELAEVQSDNLLGNIEQELVKMAEEPKNRKTKYQVREHQNTIYASSSDEKVAHMSGAGDINVGRVWRPVRRPSDMNEYAKQIREYRNQDKGKAYGKVFVKVLGIKGIHLPMPREFTAMTCTLNNGIHFVTTPDCTLGENCSIEQEFELIEHSKLEFTLTVKVRRDPHIINQFKALAAPPAPAPAPRPAPTPLPPVVAHTSSKSGGMFSLFSSSPKKSKDKHVARVPAPAPAPPPPQPSQPHRLPENLARYLKSDGTLARAFISFKDVVHRCDTRLFETSYPLIGQRAELGGKFSTQQVGEIVLQMFRLPPLPGVVPDDLPQSLEECHRGLRHINWHKVTYFQGTLTQNGGDCSTWRRRQFRIIGGNLVAFNDVTKKATASIDLKKAIRLEDDQDRRDSSRYETMYGVERSFRLIFPNDEEIVFFADTDDEKAKWLEVLRALVGHIPPHPLWAELLWQRQDEISKRAQAARQVATTYDPSSSTHSLPQ
ncbi:hypothetical protein EST38_g810 [Candolleomyces aberdarensis]|uniref:PH domain-containing protein n=1 Tax=Candolleomyces aberdarensis TaxID=2316362 RepID=A0A4Q2DZT7_9AGAR|nr:hypothetical protein EST38_g810 [Candolleomyces aberdarensis]